MKTCERCGGSGTILYRIEAELEYKGRTISYDSKPCPCLTDRLKKLEAVAEAVKIYMEKHCRCCRNSEFEIGRDADIKEALAALEDT